MLTATGKIVQKGIAVGTMRVFHHTEYRINEYDAESSAVELKRFYAARDAAVRQCEQLYEKTRIVSDEETASVFKIHAMIMEDSEFINPIAEMITGQNKSAGYAVKVVGDKKAAEFATMDDPYLQARSMDIMDIERSLLDLLSDRRDPSGMWGDAPCILVTDDLVASEMMRMNPASLLGIVLRDGSSNNHTAILARSLNIPMLIQCRDVDEEWEGTPAVVDAEAGCVYLDPTPEVYNRAARRQKAGWQRNIQLQKLRGKASVTQDGQEIHIMANIGRPEDAESALANDAEGVGLFRSEFLYIESSDYPTEDQQVEAYRTVLEAMDDKRVVVRTCDLGSDKTPDYMRIPPEENPAMGFRAIRISLSRQFRPVFRTQLRALLRASVYGNLMIMFPLITSVDQVRQCKALLEECRAELTAEGVETRQVEVGIMVETPAAVFCADELAKECDFFSIGTNDLLQYSCAWDRQNPRLENYFDPHHPALLNAIDLTVAAAKRNNCRVCVCGELAADPEMCERFIRLGVYSLSVNPKSILPLREKIRSLDLSK